MVLLTDLRCALVQHNPAFVLSIAHMETAELENPTLYDLLQDVAHIHHSCCGCTLGPTISVWNMSPPIPISAVNGFQGSSATTLTLETPLHDLGLPTAGCVNILIGLEEIQSNKSFEDYHRAFCQKRFKVLQCGDGRVLQRVGKTVRIPDPRHLSLEMCSSSGMRSVDKTPFIARLLSSIDYTSMLLTIRRPAGFGKTAFLSAVSAYFDANSTYEFFPFLYEHPSDLSRRVLWARGHLLVYSLDFGSLSLRQGMTGEQIATECNRLMSEAASQFYRRYEGTLESATSYVASPGFSHSFDWVVRWANMDDWKLFITIDNYTAPAQSTVRGVLHVVAQTVLSLIMLAVRANAVFSVLMVGDEIPGPAPWSGSPLFGPYKMLDLTLDPSFHRAIGFTEDEIRALGQATGVDIMAHVRPRYISLEGSPTTSADGELIYSSSDVLAIGRSLLGQQKQQASSTVRAFSFQSRQPNSCAGTYLAEDEYDGEFCYLSEDELEEWLDHSSSDAGDIEFDAPCPHSPQSYGL